MPEKLDDEVGRLGIHARVLKMCIEGREPAVDIVMDGNAQDT